MKFGVAAGLLAWAAFQPWTITAPAQPVRIAIFGFQPEVAEVSVAELSNDREFLLVERTELERILGELALSSSQNLKPGDALRLGKMLGADWLLVGQSLSLQGTNHLLARIVDARTGVIRDITTLPATPSNHLASAKAVADFLRSSRRTVAKLSERRFVALGAFTDLSVSKRYQDFGNRVRAWLTERFRTSSVAVVERSATDVLLAELRLSQAGLSEPRTNYTEATPAFLIADGIYQSFQDTNSKLNIVLRLQRLGERARTFAFNEAPGPALNNKLADAIEKALAENRTNVATNMRAAEVAEQIRRGRELARIVIPEQPRATLSMPFEPLREKRSKELLPAIEAFRAALFLDPDNSDAKYLLALCLIDVFAGQKEEARNLFREVIAGSTNAAFVKASRDCIADSYIGEDDEHAFELFSALYKETGSQYHSDRMASIRRALLKAGKLPWEKQIELHNEFWRAKCQAEQIKADVKQAVDFSGAFIMPIHEYSTIMGALPQRERYRLQEAYIAELLPQLKAEFPDFKHHFTLGYFDSFGTLRYRKPPTWLVRDFDEMLSWCEAQGEITSPASFYPVLARKVATFVGRTNMALAVRVAAVVNKHGRSHLPRNDADKNDLLEGFAQRELGNWTEAAAAFQRVGDREINLPGDGPWGKNSVVNAANYAKECQRRATGEAAPEITTFKLERPLFTLHEPPTNGDSEGYPINPTNLMMRHTNIFATLVYVCDGLDIWAAHGRTLHRGKLNSGKLEPVPLSVTNGSIIKALVVDKGKVWIGTRTNGLILLDPGTGICRNFTEGDGLILPSVSAILPAKDRVWVGFAMGGMLGGGGIGYLERSTDRFVGFSSELKPEKWDGAPVALIAIVTGHRSATRMPIYEIRDGGSNTLVLCSGSSIWRFSPDSKKFQQLYSEDSMSSMDSNLEYIVAGSIEPQYWSGDNPRFGGVAICRIADGKWHVISRKEGLPNGHIRSVALDGSKLWVGGRDFIALIELPAMRIARIATGLPNKESARSLQIHDGSAYAKVGSSVYRLPSAF